MIKKILIVDDSPVSRKMLKSCIPKEPEYDIVEAGDGLAGFELYKETQPDLTFMDLTMPVMDGIESLQEILKFNQDAVVIVLTADIQLKSVTNALDVGAYLVLKKPATKNSIQEAISKAEESMR